MAMYYNDNVISNNNIMLLKRSAQLQNENFGSANKHARMEYYTKVM